jgi:hypothetical protein
VAGLTVNDPGTLVAVMFQVSSTSAVRVSGLSTPARGRSTAHSVGRSLPK